MLEKGHQNHGTTKRSKPIAPGVNRQVRHDQRENSDSDGHCSAVRGQRSEKRREFGDRSLKMDYPICQLPASNFAHAKESISLTMRSAVWPSHIGGTRPILSPVCRVSSSALRRFPVLVRRLL